VENKAYKRVMAQSRGLPFARLVSLQTFTFLLFGLHMRSEQKGTLEELRGSLDCQADPLDQVLSLRGIGCQERIRQSRKG
jgi:hypothetical protein